MVREVLQSGLDAPIVFASDEHEPVGAADLVGELFKALGGFTLRIFLVHPVKHREVDRLCIDQLNVVAPTPQTIDHIFSESDSHAIGTIGAVEDEDTVTHDQPPLLTLTSWLSAYKGSSLPVCSATMYSAYQSDQFASRTPVRFSCSP